MSMFKRKTVSDVLAGFNKVIDDLKAVRDANLKRVTKANEAMEKARREESEALTEVGLANAAINNISNLIGQVAPKAETVSEV